MPNRILQAMIAVSMERALKGVTVKIVQVSSATVSKEISAKCAAIGLFRDAPTSEGF